MWTEAPVEPYSGARLPWSLVVERERHCPPSLCPNRENFEFEPHRCHPFIREVFGVVRMRIFFTIYMATVSLRNKNHEEFSVGCCAKQTYSCVVEVVDYAYFFSPTGAWDPRRLSHQGRFLVDPCKNLFHSIVESNEYNYIYF